MSDSPTREGPSMAALPIKLTAWLLLGAVVFVTIGPLGWRPVSGFPVQLERLAAFAAIGFLFALAYPRHFWLIALVVVGCAIGLELLQLVSVGRHGRIIDAVAKVTGGGAGLLIGRITTNIKK
jgi:glycopeptide antibiotics resistance protein